MAEAGPSFTDGPAAEAFLRRVGRMEGSELPLAEAALALAVLDRSGADVRPYRDHLHALAEEVAAAIGGADIADRVAALSTVLGERHDYRGDDVTYEDLQNANLMRVIDRRRGLPVALGILYIHVGRAQGWDMAGMAFPGHFLIRLQSGGTRAILNPFHRGRLCQAADLREILKSVGGPEAELLPEHSETVSDRDILLRLQNNLKLRLIGDRQYEQALRVIERMMLLAPEAADLLREAALVQAQLGNLGAAISSLERCLALAPDDRLRQGAALLLQQLKTRLN